MILNALLDSLTLSAAPRAVVLVGPSPSQRAKIAPQSGEPTDGQVPSPAGPLGAPSPTLTP